MATLILLLVLPGLVVGLAARVPLRGALAGSIPLTYGVVTLAIYIYGLVGIHWNLLSLIGATAFVAVVLLAVSLPFVSWRSLRRPHWPEMRWSLLPASGVGVSAWIIGQTQITELSTAPGALGDIFQGWDSHWHVNYLRFISETGVASPARAGDLRYPETAAELYYPSTWHALGAILADITGTDFVETYNLMQIGSLALAFPLGVAALTWMVLHRRASASTTATAAAAAAIATSLFPGLPYIEVMVAATPSAAASGLIGIVAALVVAALADRRYSVPAILALIGVGGVHPSALAASAALVLFWWLFDGLFRPVRSRLKDFLTLAVIGITGALTLLPQLLAISSDAEDIASFAFGVEGDRAALWGRAVALQVRHVDVFGVRWALLAMAAVGLVYLLAKKIVWPLLLWAVLVVLMVNGMAVFGNWTGGWLRVVASVFYNDPRRIGVVAAILMAMAVGVGFAFLASLVAEPIARLIDPITDTSGGGANAWRVVSALTALVVLVTWSLQAAPEYAKAASTNQRAGRMVDFHDQRAFEWLAQQPKAFSGLIFTNPDEGSGWMYATDGLPSTSRHYLQPTLENAPQLSFLFWNMRFAGVDSEVDRALADLGITYVYISPPNYWSFQQPNPNLLELEETPGLANVYRDGHVRIYAVRDAFTPAELDRILENSLHPPDMRTPLTRANEQYGPEYTSGVTDSRDAELAPVDRGIEAEHHVDQTIGVAPPPGG